MRNNKYDQPVNDLIEGQSPSEFISWLFDIQNSLIAAGHCGSLTKKGTEEFAGNFGVLKNFFQELHDLQTSN